jgi:rhodanese-related sulfurtransferase
MRKIVSILLLAIIVPLFVTTSCRKYDEAIEQQILVDYMTANNIDFNTISTGLVTGAALTTATPTPGIVNAADNYSIPGWTVIDVRDATTFNNGHIKGAKNIPLANILSTAPADKTTKILVVCFSGQTASRAATILKMAGYTNTKFLKWGMSAWNPAFASGPNSWNSNATQYTTTNWVTTAAPAMSEYDSPNFVTGYATGPEILNARLNAILALPWTVSKVDVLANPANYHIINKWPVAQYNAYGHVAGAYNMNDITFANLKYYNPEATTAVTYCYTGQTSAIVTAWLHVLGYENARSLSFGGNGIIHNSMLASPNVTGDPLNMQSVTWKGVGSSSSYNGSLGYGYYKTVGTNTDGEYVAP